MENTYFSTNDVLNSAVATLEEANFNLSGVSNSSKFNRAISEAINQAISNGQTPAMHWKAMNPMAHQYIFRDKFPSALFENMAPALLASLNKKGIHIYKNELGGATIQVCYTWDK